MIKTLPLLVVPFLSFTPLTGQKVGLPIRDLVRSAHLAPSPGSDVKPQLDWINRQWNPGIDSLMVMGEGALLEDRAARPWFVAGDLQTVLSTLTQLAEGCFEIEGDVLLVDGANAAATRAGLLHLRQQLPPRINLELKLERRNAAGTQTLMHVRQAVQAGRTFTFGDLANRRILQDYDVEIAQSAASANPVVGNLATGTCLATRTRVIPGKGELLIEAFARIAGAANVSPIKTLTDSIGPIDRAARHLDECGFVMRVPRGAKRTAEWTAANGDQLVLSCSGSWQDPQPGPRRGIVVRCRGLFHKPVSEFRTDSPQPDELPKAFAAEAAFKRAGADSVQVVANDQSATATIIVTGAKAEQIDADITTKLAHTLRTAELEIILLSVAADAENPRAGAKETTIARIASSVIAGKSVAFSGRTEMRYLRDWDIEVAQSSRIPDPKVAVLRHGYRVDARVMVDPDGRLSAIAIDTRVVRLDRIDATAAVISREVRAGGDPKTGGNVSPTIVLPGDVVAIESPVLMSHSISTVVQLDAKGTAVLRRAAPALLGRGRDLVVVVRVKQ